MLQLEIQFSPKTKIIRKCNFHFLFITVPRQFYTQCVNLHTVCKITHMIKVCKNLKCCPVSLLIVINAFVIVFVFLWSRHVSSTLYSNASEDKSLLDYNPNLLTLYTLQKSIFYYDWLSWYWIQGRCRWGLVRVFHAGSWKKNQKEMMAHSCSV